MSVVFSLVAGAAAVFVFPAAVALLAACKRFEVSARALVAVAMIIACAWCIAHALHGQSTGPEALLMALAAMQSLSMLRGRRILRRMSDLFPFGGENEPGSQQSGSPQRASVGVAGDSGGPRVRLAASNTRVRTRAGHH